MDSVLSPLFRSKMTMEGEEKSRAERRSFINGGDANCMSAIYVALIFLEVKRIKTTVQKKSICSPDKIDLPIFFE